GKTDTDWKEVVQNNNAVMQNYSLSARGGNEQTTFYTSGSYHDKNGLNIGTGLKRFSGKVNISHKLGERVNISNNLTGSYVDQDGSLEVGGYYGNPGIAQYYLPPIDPVYNQDGTANLNTSNPIYNPVYISKNSINKKRTNRLLNNTSIDIKVLDNLSFTSRFSIDYLLSEVKVYDNKVHGSGQYLDGSIREFDDRNFNYVWKNTLEYNWSLNENNIFNFQGIAQSQRNYKRHLRSFGTGTTEGLTNLNSVANPQGVGSTTTDWAVQSFTGLINYNYKEKLLI